MLICLSKNFLLSKWSNSEFNSVYSIQNNLGQKKVLPLILNSKTEVLQEYPLLNSINFKEISSGFDNLSEELAKLINPNLTLPIVNN